MYSSRIISPDRRKDLGDISHISQVIANFSSNFHKGRSMVNLNDPVELALPKTIP